MKKALRVLKKGNEVYMNTGKRATIREVSEYSGVSIATVSRVIHQTVAFR